MARARHRRLDFDAFGRVHDLVGNVYQWTTTTNDAVGTFRGGRGGSSEGRVAGAGEDRRAGFKNTYRCGFLGIRCSTPVP